MCDNEYMVNLVVWKTKDVIDDVANLSDQIEADSTSKSSNI